MSMSYDPLYIQYLYHFHIDRDYFECHEVMEELWMEENRSPLYQGLLQVAVGLYHARNNNTSGAIKLFSQAVNKLDSYPEHTLGIDLLALIESCRAYIVVLQQHDDAGPAFEFYDLNIDIIDENLAVEVAAFELIAHDKVDA